MIDQKGLFIFIIDIMNLRNIAIIAHVDHGKTTLVDALLKQSENFKIKTDNPTDLIMDSNELEREKGITIFSKNASIKYKETKINIVDTPGHADFGGEGPMPQTKFVLRKAIEAGHKIIVVINKIDKSDARPNWALNATYDLFIELGATDEQIDFPVIYASAVLGKAGTEPDLKTMKNIEPLFQAIIDRIPAPKADKNGPLQMLTVNLQYDNYRGRIAVGRLYSGVLKKGAWVSHINRRGEIKKVQIANVMLFDGLNRIDVPEAVAGEIVAVSGIPEISIGETIAALENPKALPIIHIDEPTIKMTFGVNTSPFVGREGEYTTSRNLRERLIKELETDVALKVEETDKADRFIVSGRGELHLAILIEKMRREGYELEVSKPQVIFKENENGVTEPIETVSIEVPEEYAGVIIEMMGKRLAKMKDMNIDNHTMKMDFEIPTRGLIGVRNEFMTSTKGSGIMNTLFSGYAPYKGKLAESTHGSIITTETGITNNYGLVSAQGRGKLFMGAGVEVYEGMVIGENAKSRDELVNVCRQRELTNFRAKNDGLQDQLEVPLKLTLEDALDYIHDDELVEITPKSIRIRKRYLTENDRRKAAKEKKTEAR